MSYPQEKLVLCPPKAEVKVKMYGSRLKAGIAPLMTSVHPYR